MKHKRLNSFCVKFKIGLLTILTVVGVTALGGDVLAVSAGDSIKQIVSQTDYYLPSYVVLTKYGKVYTYGVNVDGRIGNGTTCGDYGEVSSKLDNMLGDDESSDDITLDDVLNLGSDCFYSTPQDITNLFGGDKIVQVGVGYAASAGFKDESFGFVALSESGTLYAWGGLSRESGAPIMTPTKVEFPDELDIERIRLANLTYGLTSYPVGATSSGKEVFYLDDYWIVNDYSGILPSGAVARFTWHDNDDMYLATTNSRIYKVNFDDISYEETNIEATLDNGDEVRYVNHALVDGAKYEDVTEIYSSPSVKDAIYYIDDSLMLGSDGSLYFGDANLTTKYNLPLVDELLSEYNDYSSGDRVDYTLVKTNDGHVLGIPYIDEDGAMSKEIRYYDDLFTGPVERISVGNLNGNYAYTTKEMPGRINVLFTMGWNAPKLATSFDVPLESGAYGIDGNNSNDSVPGAPSAGLGVLVKNPLAVLSTGIGIVAVLVAISRRRKTVK